MHTHLYTQTTLGSRNSSICCLITLLYFADKSHYSIVHIHCLNFLSPTLLFTCTHLAPAQGTVAHVNQDHKPSGHLSLLFMLKTSAVFDDVPLFTFIKKCPLRFILPNSPGFLLSLLPVHSSFRLLFVSSARPLNVKIS